MSYQVLARKWRPNRFGELVGQEHVVAAISNALDNNRLHHAYLFTGTRGVGKTTIARIFSKSLNCEQGLSAKPCGQCSTCKEIENGNFIDLLEIDAASRTKVEDTRELLDNVQYKPSRGRYKVYLIDEVHMLSKHSFNALLKTLEEPPPHVKFLLATTDPQKLPVTILSRCLQFNLKALSRSQISQQLEHVLGQEQIPFETESLSQLARAAQGSMRDALSLTDQAIAQGNGQVSLKIVTDMLGLMDKNQVVKLVHAVVNKDSQKVMQQVELMAEQAPDFALVLAEIMSLLHQVALTQFVPDACKLETISARAIFQLAKAIPAEHIQLLYQIALAGKKDLPHAVDPRTGLEMTLLRMLAFCPNELKVEPIQLGDMAKEASKQPISTKAEQDTASQPEAQSKLSTELPAAVSSEEAKHVQPEEKQTADQLQAEPTIQPPQPVEVPQPTSTEAHANESQPVDIAASDSVVEQIDNEAELFAQQDDILRQAEDFGHQDFDYNEFEPVGLHEHEPQNQPLTPESYSADSTANVEQPNSNHAAATSTADLIALRNKIKSTPRETEEDKASVKKSEGKAPFDLAAIRKQQESAQPTPAPEPEYAESQQGEAQPAELFNPAPVTEETQTTELPVAEKQEQSESIDSASLNQPLNQQQTSSATTESVPDTSSEPLASQDNNSIEMCPPWSNDEAAANTEMVGAEDQQASLPEPDVFDPNAHLDDENVGEVTIEIPAFLADKQKVIKAKQVDDWSHLIEEMQVTALTKQLALHSSFSRTGDKVQLTLLENKEHLISGTAEQQLQDALSATLNSPIQLEIQLGQPINTPYALQLKVNQVRNEYAQEVIKTDPGIQLLQQQFAAKVDPQSIQAR